LLELRHESVTKIVSLPPISYSEDLKIASYSQIM
jgi:hypothetical protein